MAPRPRRADGDRADAGALPGGRRRLRAAEGGGRGRREASCSATPPLERFDAALAPLPLPQLDLLPALRGALPGPDLFFQETVHLTPRGHDVVAARSTRSSEQRLL